MGDDVVPPHMSGYLHKKAASGKWQRRWFETNSHFLTYYKSRKMEKLLAALNLPQVGDISIAESDLTDPENLGCCFTIELNSRVYIMKADTREEALRWVEVLKELQRSDVQKRKHSESPHASIMDHGESKRVGVSYLSRWEKKSGCMGICGCMRLV